MSLNRDDATQVARVLTESLPYIQRFTGRTFVIKFGGNAMVDAELFESFARDVVLMKLVGMNPIIVHGGGPQIGQLLDRLAIQSEFIEGMRVTDEPTMDVVEMVLGASVNKEIVDSIHRNGGRAVGLTGKDGELLRAKKLQLTAASEEQPDIGQVGEVTSVDTRVLQMLGDSDFIPVIAPIAGGEDGKTYNINADTAAGAIAAALGATRMLMLTDVAGVLDSDGNLITDLTVSQAEALIRDGTVSGGMIPKVETCINAVLGGAEAAVIMDGRAPHALLVELFTEHGMGTMIRAD